MTVHQCQATYQAPTVVTVYCCTLEEGHEGAHESASIGEWARGPGDQRLFDLHVAPEASPPRVPRRGRIFATCGGIGDFACGLQIRVHIPGDGRAETVARAYDWTKVDGAWKCHLCSEHFPPEDRE